MSTLLYYIVQALASTADKKKVTDILSFFTMKTQEGNMLLLVILGLP